MPSQYAHYRFGKEAFSALPPQAKSCVQRFRRLYEMGLQGPDIFFYHNPFWHTAAGELGSKIHQLSGKEFFTQAAAQANSEAAQAYLYGLLGHYCLDAQCHPYIDRIEKAGEGKHAPMEKEFDRYLMTQDQLPDPHTQDLSPRIRLTRGECVTVALFYPPATPGQINRSVRNMRLSLRYLSGKDQEKRKKLLKRIKPSLLEQMVPGEPLEQYARSNSELLVRYRWALEQYPELVAKVIRLRTGGEALDERFEKHF